MKRNLLLSLFIMAFSLLSFAETPAQMTYQAVVRAADGKVLVEKPVGVKFSILHSNENGSVVFQETHTSKTNKNGLITVFIGGGQNLQGTLAAINWANGPYFLKMEVDIDGGTNYALASTSQMLTVPYAFYAEKANAAAILIDEAGAKWAVKDGKLVEASDVNPSEDTEVTDPDTGAVYKAKTLVKWPNEKIHYSGEVKLREGTTVIGNGAFKDCTKLRKIDIPNTVTEIGENAFEGCSNLRTVTIPASVKIIKKHAFLDCTNLSSVQIPSETDVEEGAFKGTMMYLEINAKLLEDTELLVGEKKTIRIDYSLRPTVSSSNENVATAELKKSGHFNLDVEITAIAEGEAIITISDLPLAAKKTIKITVKAEEVSEDGMSWVDIKAGSFRMGSPSSESERSTDEEQHEVTISKDFKISKYAVTFDEYDAFCDATERTKPEAKWGRGKQPVINVSWEDAKAYADWKGCRLPTEAEWEYACRAGTTTPFSFGGAISDTEVNYNATYPYDGTTNYHANFRRQTIEVGSLKKPNEWELHDMHGNVWEWCSDWYVKFTDEPATDPTGPASGTDKVVKGGAWNSKAEDCRSARRLEWAVTHKSDKIGFRLAKDAD